MIHSNECTVRNTSGFPTGSSIGSDTTLLPKNKRKERLESFCLTRYSKFKDPSAALHSCQSIQAIWNCVAEAIPRENQHKITLSDTYAYTVILNIVIIIVLPVSGSIPQVPPNGGKLTKNSYLYSANLEFGFHASKRK